MSENNVENPQVASQVEQLVRPDSNVAGHDDVAAEQLRLLRIIAEKMCELADAFKANDTSSLERSAAIRDIHQRGANLAYRVLGLS